MDVLFELHYTIQLDDDDVERVYTISVPHLIVQEASRMAVFQYAMRQAVLYLERMGHDVLSFDYLALISY